MDVIKIASLSEDLLDNLIQRLAQACSTKQHGREFTETVRQLHQVWAIRWKDFDVTGDMIINLLSVLEDDAAQLKLKQLCAYLLGKWISGPMPMLQENTRALDKKLLTILLPLLLTTSSGTNGPNSALQSNLSNIVAWLTTQEHSLRSSTFPLLLHTLRHRPQWIRKYRRPLEAQMIEWLTNASTQLAKPSATGVSSFLKLANTNKSIPVSEPDGSPCRDIFTVLNVAPYFTSDQIFNMWTFSSMYTWIYELYLNPAAPPSPPLPTRRARPIESNSSSGDGVGNTEGGVNGNGAEADEEVDETSQTPTGPVTMDHRLKEALIRYCQRVIEQSKQRNRDDSAERPEGISTSTTALNKSLDSGSLYGSGSGILGSGVVGTNATVFTEPQPYRRHADLVVLEAVRILDALCTVDSALVNKLFGIIKKLFNIQRLGWTTRATGYILLQVLEFFLHHGEVVLYDPEPLFRQYFDGFVAETFVDPLMAIETLIFLARHKVVLSNTSNVFQQHFHVILRILAWFPVESVDLVAEILPACIGPNTCLELFHTLLDLPLLSAALERLHRDHQHATTAANERGGSGSQSYSGSVLSNQSASEHYGILFNMLLRKESGIVVNFWDSVQTMNQVKEFSTEVEKAGGTTTSSPNSSPNLTRRLAACGDAVATLCNTFYDVVTAYADETLLQQLVGLAIERMDQLACYMHPVKATIRNILLQRTLAIIRKHPVCVVNLKETIMQVIGESIHNPARRELLLHLCWSVGEYASPVLLPSCTSQLLFDYEEALELLLFEVIALTAAEITAARDHNPTAQRSGSIKKKRGEEDEENDGLEPEFSEIEEAIQSNAESTGGAAGAGTATQSNYQLRLMLVIISAITKLASRWQPLASRVVLCLTNIVPKAEMVHPSLLDRVNHSLAMIQQPSIAANLFETPLTGASSGPAIASTHHLDSRSSLRFLLQPVSAPLSVMEIELAAASSFLDRTDVSDEDEEETEDDMDDGTTKNDAPMRRGSQPLMAELPRW